MNCRLLSKSSSIYKHLWIEPSQIGNDFGGTYSKHCLPLKLMHMHKQVQFWVLSSTIRIAPRYTKFDLRSYLCSVLHFTFLHSSFHSHPEGFATTAAQLGMANQIGFRFIVNSPNQPANLWISIYFVLPKAGLCLQLKYLTDLLSVLEITIPFVIKSDSAVDIPHYHRLQSWLAQSIQILLHLAPHTIDTRCKLLCHCHDTMNCLIE